MTFRAYLEDNKLGTAFESGPDTVRNRIVLDWERQSHLDFRAAGERHAEPAGITDEVVQKHVTRALTCRAIGCDNIALVSKDGLCEWCAAEFEALNYESIQNPYRRKYWSALYFAIMCVIVTLAVIVGVVREGSLGR